MPMPLSPMASRIALRCAARSASRSRCQDAGGAGATLHVSAALAAAQIHNAGAMARKTLRDMDAIIDSDARRKPVSGPAALRTARSRVRHRDLRGQRRPYEAQTAARSL